MMLLLIRNMIPPYLHHYLQVSRGGGGREGERLELWQHMSFFAFGSYEPIKSIN
jgi:hypothetical protein